MFNRFCLCLGLLTVFAAPALADDYPDRTVQLVVTVEPGGTADATARYLAKEMSSQLKQPYVVENKPGGAGIVAAENVSNARPDGYTLLYAADAMAIVPSSMPNLSIDLQQDLTPITLVGVAPFVMVVNPSIPVKNPKELVAYIKQHPGKFRWGVGGIGTAGQFAIARFSQMAGINALQVPYKGSAPATLATLSGEVDGTVALYTTVKALIAAGKLTALGVASPGTSDNLTGLPTIASFGFPGYQALSWFGVWGPKNMSADQAQQIHDQVLAALTAPELQKQFAQAGITVTLSKNPAEFAAYFQSETQKDGAIVRQIKAENAVASTH
jgi:tripartite-type tricarboxylate transporter receptor subunit TctC